MGSLELRRQSCKALKQHGEYEDVDEGVYGSMQKAPGGAHAQVMVARVLEKRWLEGRAANTKTQRLERWPL